MPSVQIGKRQQRSKKDVFKKVAHILYEIRFKIPNFWDQKSVGSTQIFHGHHGNPFLIGKGEITLLGRIQGVRL